MATSTLMMAYTAGASMICIYCEYDLRGIAKDANCPECGLPLLASTDIDIPGPISSIAWIRIGLLLIVVQLCAELICSSMAIYFKGSTMARIQLVWLLTILLSCILRAFGSWWMTISCDRAASCGRWRMRILVRTLALISIALELLNGGLYYIGGVAPQVEHNIYLASWVLQALWIASVGLYLGGSMSYAGLAVRIRCAAGLLCLVSLLTALIMFWDAIWPNPDVISSLRVVSRGVLGICGLLLVLWLARELLAMRNWYLQILVSLERMRQQTISQVERA